MPKINIGSSGRMLDFHKALDHISNNHQSYVEVHIMEALEPKDVFSLAYALSKNNIIRDLFFHLTKEIEESSSNHLGQVLANNINIKKIWIDFSRKFDINLISMTNHLKDSNLNFVGITIGDGADYEELIKRWKGNDKIKGLYLFKSNFRDQEFINLLNGNPQLEDISLNQCDGLGIEAITYLITMIREKNHIRKLRILQDIAPEQRIFLIESLKLNNVITQFEVNDDRYPDLFAQIELTITRNLELLERASLKLKEGKKLNTEELNILEAHINDRNTLEIFSQELRDKFFIGSARIKYLLESFSFPLPFNVRLPNEIGPVINEYVSIKHLIALNFGKEVTKEISEAFLQHFERAPNLFKEFFLSHNMWLIIKALKSDMPFTEILANGQKLANDRKSAELITNHPKILGFLITRNQKLLDYIIKNIINDDECYALIKDDYKNIAFLSKAATLLTIEDNSSNNKISISLSDLLYKSTISFKSLDFMVDTFRSINEPNAENAQKTLRDVIHLQSIFTGNNIYSMALSSIDIANQLAKGDVQEAGKQLIITISYMALPTMLSFTGIPYLGLAYGSLMAGYTGYHAINNAYSLYSEYGTVEWQLKSAEAYENLYEALSYCYNEEWNY